MNKFTKYICLLPFLAVGIACSDDLAREEGFFPMNPDQGEEPVINPYWAWTDKFPGSVSQQLRRVEDTLVTVKGGYSPFTFDAQADILQSTGLYVPLGETVKVNVPAGITGLHYQIGIHGRKLANGQVRLRYDDVVIRGELIPGENEISNWFGGFLYFYYPASQAAISDVQVGVKGCVATSDFIFGKTDWKAWLREKLYNLQQDTIFSGADTLYEARQGLRWTELRSDKVILSIGTSELKEIESPEVVMDLYGKIADSYYAFRGLENNGDMPLRVYTDIQLPDASQTPAAPATNTWFAGKYPTAFIRGAGDEIVDAGRILNTSILKAQNSATYGDWYALFFAFNEMFRSEWDKGWWTGMTDRASYYYYANRNGVWPGKFIDFKTTVTEQSDAAKAVLFEARGADARLAMAMQLVNEVGWELFPYISRREREHHFVNEWRQEVIDFFAMSASEYAGKNLIPFFTFWKIYLSEYATNYMKQFPASNQFWKTFDQNKMPDFEPRTPDLSHERGPKPQLPQWIEEREDWTAIVQYYKNGKLLTDSRTPSTILQMFDDNKNTFYENPQIPLKEANKNVVVTVDMKKECTFNAIYYQVGSKNIRRTRAIEKIEVWENGTWNTVESPVLDAVNNSSTINYFYLWRTCNASQIRLTISPTTDQPDFLSVQIAELKLGVYSASLSSGETGND